MGSYDYAAGDPDVTIRLEPEIVFRKAGVSGITKYVLNKGQVAYIGSRNKEAHLHVFLREVRTDTWLYYGGKISRAPTAATLFSRKSACERELHGFFWWMQGMREQVDKCPCGDC